MSITINILIVANIVLPRAKSILIVMVIGITVVRVILLLVRSLMITLMVAITIITGLVTIGVQFYV